MSRIVIVILIYHRHKPIDLIKISVLDKGSDGNEIIYKLQVK
jgi:hypothetical protein